MRYRAMPLLGRQILWAKDLAYVLLLTVVVLPLSLWTGLTFGLAALAIGHIPSVGLRLPQLRWRFTGGRVIYGVPQMVAGIALASGEQQLGPSFLLLSAAAYLISLYFCGRWWDRHPLHWKQE